MSVVDGGGYYSRPPEVEFSWMSEGWTLFKQDAVTWVLAVLIVGALLAGFSGFANAAFGLTTSAKVTSLPTTAPGWVGLMVPHSATQIIASFLQSVLTTLLSAGLYRMAIRQVRGERVQVVDLFGIGDVIVPLLGYSVLSWLLTYVGTLLCCIPGLIVEGLLLFAPLYIVAEGASATEAISRSFNILQKQWLMAATYYFVGSLFVVFSVLACCVGELAAAPVFILSVAVGFARFNGGSSFGPGIPNYGPAGSRHMASSSGSGSASLRPTATVRRASTSLWSTAALRSAAAGIRPASSGALWSAALWTASARPVIRSGSAARSSAWLAGSAARSWAAASGWGTMARWRRAGE